MTNTAITQPNNDVCPTTNTENNMPDKSVSIVDTQLNQMMGNTTYDSDIEVNWGDETPNTAVIEEEEEEEEIYEIDIDAAKKAGEEVFNTPLKEEEIENNKTFNYYNQIMAQTWLMSNKMTFDNVNYYDIEKFNLIESLEAPKYVHLYFDFDEIQDAEEYLEVIEFLERVKLVFGEYSIGGYTNDAMFAEEYHY